jgi:histidyl-tRNA synthetase
MQYESLDGSRFAPVTGALNTYRTLRQHGETVRLATKAGLIDLFFDLNSRNCLRQRIHVDPQAQAVAKLKAYLDPDIKRDIRWREKVVEKRETIDDLNLVKVFKQGLGW